MSKKKHKKECDVCGGSGQISYFKGVSRFLLTTEECGECAGTGFQLQQKVGIISGRSSGDKKNLKKKK